MLKLGRLVRFVPVPVVAGFTAGIGAIIFIGQLPRALGLQPPPEAHVIDVVRHLGAFARHVDGVALALSASSLAICLGLPLVSRRVPAPLAAVVVPALAVAALGLETPAIGALPRTLPLPHLEPLPTGDLLSLASVTFIVFALASLETLLSSTVVDKLAPGPRHDPDQELIGQGLGNAACALFGGIPVTGVIARSGLAVQAGAKTRRASVVQSLALLAMVFALAPLISRIPLAALAGVLLAVALRMMHPRELAMLWRVSRSEAAVYLVTFVVIVLGDLILGVQAGFAAALLVGAIRLGQVQAHLHTQERADHARVTLRGPVTFLSSAKIERLRAMVERLPPGRAVVFDLHELSALDASGAEMLTQLVASIRGRASGVALVGLAEPHLSVLRAADPERRLEDVLADSEIDVLRVLNPGDAARPIERLRAGVFRFQRTEVERKRALFAKLATTQTPHTLFSAAPTAG